MAWRPWSELDPEDRQAIAAINAGTWAMSDEDETRWFAEHPVSDFVEPGDRGTDG